MEYQAIVGGISSSVNIHKSAYGKQKDEKFAEFKG
jgi:hypothetical protein